MGHRVRMLPAIHQSQLSLAIPPWVGGVSTGVSWSGGIFISQLARAIIVRILCDQLPWRWFAQGRVKLLSASMKRCSEALHSHLTLGSASPICL